MKNLNLFIQKYTEIPNISKRYEKAKGVEKMQLLQQITRTHNMLEKLAYKILGEKRKNAMNIVYNHVRNKLFLNRYRKKNRTNENLRKMKIRAGSNNFNTARNKIIQRMHLPARTIQRAFRASRLTNERKLNLARRAGSPNRISNYKHRRLGSVPINNMVRIKRERNASFRTPWALKKITNIQRTFRGYRTRVIEPRRAYLEDLKRDGRFKPYVTKLEKLQTMIPEVVRATRAGGAAKETIFKLISECHYSPRPALMYRNARFRDVRRKLNQMKKLKPREYLKRFLHQFSYVAKEYSKMSPGNKAEYRDRLESEAGSRPCLENLLESMVKVLSKPEFVWLGKAKNFENSPLVPDNARYLGYGLPKPTRGLVNTAIQTWKNVPKNWAHMNLNARKNVFWGMIKNLPVSMVNSGTIVYGTPASYNRRGEKFRASNLSNMLNYIEPVYVEPPPAPMKRKRSPG